jgi:putative oxidoreductase
VDVSILAHGVGFSPLSLLAARLCLGTFFAIAGAHKLFYPDHVARFRDSFAKWGLKSPLWAYAIPGGELAGGAALVAGFLAVPAALGLILICSGACVLDGLGRITAKTRIDAVSQFLYLPEVLYVALLAFIVAQGAGAFSLDALVFH